MFDEALVTVWSAPNYCYRCGNMASILTIRGRGNNDGGLSNGEGGNETEAVNGGEVGRFFTVFGAAAENERDKGMQTRKLVRTWFLFALPYAFGADTIRRPSDSRAPCNTLYDKCARITMHIGTRSPCTPITHTEKHSETSGGLF